MNDRPLDIHQLKKSVQYRIRQTFRDYYGNQFNQGEVLTFISYSFLPYHGGYTVVFQEKSLYLQEEQNAAILDSLGDYFAPVDNS
ncbi:MAG TPA: DUF3601 domain-containing protein [Anaerolineales bacterium]|nr:DUF3601 domain-containing protein [Anaerolineales bacterium]